MFARIAALGALALLMTVPAGQAASFTSPLECAATYQAQPYTGPEADAESVLDALAACTPYNTHDGAVPEFRLLFVPYVPAAETPEFGIQFVPYVPLPGTFTRDVSPADLALEVAAANFPLLFEQHQDPLEPQTLPGFFRPTAMCKADACYYTGPTMTGGESLPAQLAAALGYPMVCVQAYPYSLICTVPNAAFETAIAIFEF